MSRTNSFEFQWSSGGRDSRITWAVQALILINVGVYIVQLLLNIPFGNADVFLSSAAAPGGFLINWLRFEPVSFLQGYLWQPFTYMFLHAGGLSHLVMNMLCLFFFGPEVERTLGTRQFLRFYLLCGAVGVLANFVSPWAWQTGVVGASGAIMGVLVAYAIINPEGQFYLFPLPVPITARALVYFLIGMNIFYALTGSTTSVPTHLGGMAVGAAYMKLIPKFREWQKRTAKTATQSRQDPLDSVGEAVDNIFKFDSKKTRRK